MGVLSIRLRPFGMRVNLYCLTNVAFEARSRNEVMIVLDRDFKRSDGNFYDDIKFCPSSVFR